MGGVTVDNIQIDPGMVAPLITIPNESSKLQVKPLKLMKSFFLFFGGVSLVLYASTRVTFHFVLRHSRHLSVVLVMPPSFPSLLRHRRLFILRTVHYRLSSSLRLSSFVYSFVTDLFRPCHVPIIIYRICGYTIIL